MTGESKGIVQQNSVINEVLASSFFVNKKEEDWRCLVQGMMLLDTRYVNGGEVRDYVESIKESYTDQQKNTLKSAIEYLENAFPEGNKDIKTTSMPLLIYLADVAEYEELSPRRFKDWWLCFIEKDMTKSFYRYFELDYLEEKLKG